jgi:hypothetical protein
MVYLADDTDTRQENNMTGLGKSHSASKPVSKSSEDEMETPEEPQVLPTYIGGNVELTISQEEHRRPIIWLHNACFHQKVYSHSLILSGGQIG